MVKCKYLATTFSTKNCRGKKGVVTLEDERVCWNSAMGNRHPVRCKDLAWQAEP